MIKQKKKKIIGVELFCKAKEYDLLIQISGNVQEEDDDRN